MITKRLHPGDIINVRGRRWIVDKVNGRASITAICEDTQEEKTFWNPYDNTSLDFARSRETCEERMRNLLAPVYNLIEMVKMPADPDLVYDAANFAQVSIDKIIDTARRFDVYGYDKQI